MTDLDTECQSDGARRWQKLTFPKARIWRLKNKAEEMSHLSKGKAGVGGKGKER
jgi:hypothetical protein